MRRFLLLLAFGFSAAAAFSQVAISSSDDIIQELENLSLENSAMEITGYTFFGDTAALGVFNRISGPFPLDFGLVISSGSVVKAVEGSGGGLDDNNGLDEDIDLENLLNTEYDLLDCSSLEIHFTALEEELSLSFVFGSDEYENFTCSAFGDLMSVFLRKDQEGEEFESIAFVPDTDIPVTVNSLNGGVSGAGNEDFCDEANPDWEETFIYYLENNLSEYGHFIPATTIALPATASLEVGENYVLKLAVCDMADPIFNSYGFLSFSGSPAFDCPLAEVNVGDNCSVSSETVEMIGPNCECNEYLNGVVFAIDLNPNYTIIDPGDTVFVEATVQNFGALTSGEFNVNFYRSLDFQLDGSDELIFSTNSSGATLFEPQYFDFEYSDYPMPYQNFKILAEIVSDENSNPNNPTANSVVNFTPNTPCDVSAPEEFSPLIIEPTASQVGFSYQLYNPGPSDFDEYEIRVYWSATPNYQPFQSIFLESHDGEDLLPGETDLVETIIDIPEDLTETDYYIVLVPQVGALTLIGCQVPVPTIFGFLSAESQNLAGWKAWLNDDRQLDVSSGKTYGSQTTLHLYDAVGRPVFQKSVNLVQGQMVNFPLPDITAGVYILCIENGGRNQSFKLINLK